MDILKLISHLNEFDYYDKFSLSPDHSKIAYVKRRKPSTAHFQDLNESNGTPFSSLGCELWVTYISTGESYLISEKNSWRPSWSPDGAKIVFYSDINGFPQLWLYSFNENKTHLICENKVKAMFTALDRSCWSKDSQTIFFPSIATVEEKPDQTKSFSQEMQVKVFKSPIYGSENIPSKSIEELCLVDITKVDVNTGKAQEYVSKDHSSKPAFFSISPSGNYISYISVLRPGIGSEHYYIDLWILNLNENSIECIDHHLSVHPILKTLPFVYVPNEDKIIFLKDEKIILADLLLPQTKEILFESKEYKLSDLFFLISLSGLLIIAIEGADKSIIKKLLMLNIKQPDQTAIINLENFPEYTAINDILLLDDKVMLLTQDSKTLETIHLEFNISAGNHTVIETVPHQYCYMKDFVNISHSQFLGYYENPDQNGELALFNHRLNVENFVTQINEPIQFLPGYSMNVFTTELITRSGKKQRVNTTILLPKNFLGGAIIDFYPGSMPSKTIGEFATCITSSVFPRMMFLQAGFALILPDIPLEYVGVDSLLLEFVSLLMPQIENICQSIEGLSSCKMGIIGQSFGAYGVAGIISQTQLFQAAVAMNGIYDLMGSYGYIDKYHYFFQRRWIEEGQCQMGHHPWANPQHYINNSPYYLANQINTPLLLIHGEIDNTCPAVESEKMFTALDRLGKNVELAIYLKEEHSPFLWREKNYINVGERVLDYFQEHLR